MRVVESAHIHARFEQRLENFIPGTCWSDGGYNSSAAHGERSRRLLKTPFSIETKLKRLCSLVMEADDERFDLEIIDLLIAYLERPIAIIVGGFGVREHVR